MRNLWILSVLLCALPVWSNTNESSDTTIYYKGKKFELSESSDPVEVKVYSKKGEKMEQIYEGKFEDGEKSSSKWEVNEVFSVPFLDPKKGIKSHSNSPKKSSNSSKKKKVNYYFEPHWSGIGVGFIYPTDRNWGIMRDYSDNGISFNEALSLELAVNIHDFGFPLYKNILGLTCGIGLNWRNMTLDGNKIFTRINDHELSIEGNGTKVSYSTMMTVDVVVPLLLEWHIPNNGQRSSGFSIAAGAQLNVKTFSCARSKFVDDGMERKTFIRGIGSNVLSGDAVVQVGFRYLSIYAKRSLAPMFQKEKGPQFYPSTIGIQYIF